MTKNVKLLARIKMVAIFSPLLITLSGCSKQEAQDKEHASVQTVQAPLLTVKAGPVANNYEAEGTVVSKVSANISSKVVGVVKSANFETGDRVIAGKLLVEIDQAETMARLRQARSRLDAVERELEEADSDIKAARYACSAAESRKVLEDQTFRRYAELRERQSVSPQEFDDASARARTAVAELDRAQQNIKSLEARRQTVLAKIEESRGAIAEVQSQLSYLTIGAPFAGLITQKNVNIGDLAAPGAVLLKLEKDDYRLEVPVDESAVSTIASGQAIAVVFAGKEIQTTVAEIVPKADPQSRSFNVKLNMPAGCGARSGMYGKAFFPLGERNTISIPAKALLENGQLTYVFALDSTDIARMRVIKTGRAVGDRVEVLSGLSSGDRIVATSVPALADGMKVESRNQ